jgi:hypothetical protein
LPHTSWFGLNCLGKMIVLPVNSSRPNGSVGNRGRSYAVRGRSGESTPAMGVSRFGGGRYNAMFVHSFGKDELLLKQRLYFVYSYKYTVVLLVQRKATERRERGADCRAEHHDTFPCTRTSSWESTGGWEQRAAGCGRSSARPAAGGAARGRRWEKPQSAAGQGGGSLPRRRGGSPPAGATEAHGDVAWETIGARRRKPIGARRRKPSGEKGSGARRRWRARGHAGGWGPRPCAAYGKKKVGWGRCKLRSFFLFSFSVYPAPSI